MHQTITLKHKTMRKSVTVQRNIRTNKVEFFRNGNQIFDFTISGNIVTFSDGKTILL